MQAPAYDIVFFTLFRTDNPYSSISLSMAKELAKSQRVFYVNHPYTLKDIFTDWRKGDLKVRERLWHLLTFRLREEAVDSIPKNFVAIQPPATLPINWLPKGGVYDLFQKLNNAVVLKSIRKTLDKYQIKDFVFINCYDPFYAGYLPPAYGAKLCIYHCIDDITQNAYTDKHGTDLENEAVRGADVTFVTSTNLKKLKEPYSDRIEYYFNAADVEVFKKVIHETYPRPAELANRPGKVIGFIGNLDELRIDYPLLLKVADQHPDKTLLLVGPINSPEPRELGMDQRPNIVFAGSRRLADLPPLLQHMDCVLIPFLKNTLTKSIYPLKINEYLAAGKPVVSTSFSDDIRGFSDCIFLAENEAEFIARIDPAIAANQADAVQKRVDVANGNTWEMRIRQLWKIVDQRTKQ